MKFYNTIFHLIKKNIYSGKTIPRILLVHLFNDSANSVQTQMLTATRSFFSIL